MANTKQDEGPSFNTSVLISNAASDFKAELDSRNEEVLKQLNMQIDQLASKPLKSSLPAYDDRVELDDVSTLSLATVEMRASQSSKKASIVPSAINTSPDTQGVSIIGRKSIKTPLAEIPMANASFGAEIGNISFQLKKDLEEFKQLAQEARIPLLDESLASSGPPERRESRTNPGADATRSTMANLSLTSESNNGNKTENAFDLSNSFAKNMFLEDDFTQNNTQFTQDTEALFARVDVSTDDESLIKTPVPASIRNPSPIDTATRGQTTNIPATPLNSAFSMIANPSESARPSVMKSRFSDLNADFGVADLSERFESIRNGNQAAKEAESVASGPSASSKTWQSRASAYSATQPGLSSPTVSHFGPDGINRIRSSASVIADNTESYRPLSSVPADDGSIAVVNALRTLQERVGKLEGEKVAAKEKITDLERELSTTRKLLYHQQTSPAKPAVESKKDVVPDVIADAPAFSKPDALSNIFDAKQMVSELKSKMDHLHEIATPERHKGQTAFKPPSLFDPTAYNIPHQPEKHDADTGFLSETEIVQLQREIEAERLAREARKRFEDQNALKQKLIEKVSKDPTLSKTTTKKKKQQGGPSDPSWRKVLRKAKPSSRDGSVPNSAHVRKRPPIDMPFVVEKAKGDERLGREMPFIVGQNAGKSFSVTANLQRVFSMLKSHNPGLCSICSKRHPTASHEEHTQQSTRRVHVVEPKATRKHFVHPANKKQDIYDEIEVAFESPLSAGVGPSGTENLRNALGALEEEFRDLKNNYNLLVSDYERIAESTTSYLPGEISNARPLKAIGDELRLVIQQMETKGDQITILREILQSSILHRTKHLGSRIGASTDDKLRAKHYELSTVTSRSKSQEINIPNVRSLNGNFELPHKSSQHGDQRGRISNKSSLRVDVPSDTAGPHWSTKRTLSQSPGRAMASLSLLKSSFKVQNALGTSS